MIKTSVSGLLVFSWGCLGLLPVLLSAQEYSEPITWSLEDHDPGGGELYKTLRFETVGGVGYTLQSSGDLQSWNNEQFVYGTGQEVVVSLWSHNDLQSPPAPGQAPDSYEELPTYVSMVLKKVTGESGILVSWVSLEDQTAIQYHLSSTELTPAAAWNATPLHLQTVGDYTYAILNETIAPPEPQLPVGVVSSLNGDDAAFIAAFVDDLSTISTTVGNGYSASVNTPPRPPRPDGGRNYFRLAANWGLNSDGDYRPDWMEWAESSGTDPFNGDSDGDGELDGQSEDFDGDGIVDAEDAVSNDERISWRKSSEFGYIWVPIGNTPAGLDPGAPVAINNGGTVLFERAVWIAGNWTALNLGPGATSVTGGTLDWATTGSVVSAKHLNDSGQIVGSVDIHGFDFPWSELNHSATVVWQTTDGPPELIGSDLWAVETPILRIDPGGIDSAGLIYTRQANDDGSDYASVFSGAGSLLSGLPSPGDLSRIKDVSSGGSVVGNTNAGAILKVWKKQGTGHILHEFSPDPPALFRHITDLPNGRIAVSGSGNSLLPLLEDNDGILGKSPYLPSASIIGGDGTALGTDQNGNSGLWRNGKTTPLAELSEEFAEVLNNPTVHGSYGFGMNDRGSILIQAFDEEQDPVETGVLVKPEVQMRDFANGGWKSVDELKVAKWENAWNADGSVFNTEFIPTDDDRFRIRVDAKTLPQEAREVYISTVGTPESEAEYGDTATKIVLKYEPAAPGLGVHSDGFVSEPMILVADLVDNKFSNDHQTDDHTHIVALGGVVEFRSKNPSVEPFATVPVNIKHTVKVVSKVVSPNGQVSEELLELAHGDFKVARQVFAQVGIEVIGGVQFVEVPAGVDLGDGLVLDDSASVGTLTLEAINLLEALATPGDQTDVVCIYLDGVVTSALQQVKGIALPFGFGDADQFSKTFLISLPSRNKITWSHELGHILLQGVGGDLYNHWNTGYNLLKSGGGAYSGEYRWDTKRLLPEQEEQMHKFDSFE